MKYFYRIILLSILLAHSFKIAQAVPPPDFIFNIGTQIVQAFTFLALGFSLVAGAFKGFFERHPFFMAHKKLLWSLLAILVILISLGGAYLYGKYKQNSEYDKWLHQSQQQADQMDPNADTSQDGIANGDASLDKLKIGELRGPEEMANDNGARFIKAYYNSIATGKLKEAYQVSEQKVDYPTYVGWYKNISAVNVDSIQKIDENKYSLGLTLVEPNNAQTRYAVLMELTNTGDVFKVKHTDVRVLTQQNGSSTLPAGSNSYFDNNSGTSIVISNGDFSRISSNAFVLDAREDEEYEIGNYPGSHHIRFADIVAGDWIKLPTDQPIYVMCWSGLRGKEAAEFLRQKKILARYVEGGADGWVSYGGRWNGGVKFRDVHTGDQYKVVFSTDQIKEKIGQGVVIVDSRSPEKFKKHHAPGSISVPVFSTPSSEMAAVLDRVPKNSTVITVCDDYINCFIATVTGLKLERRGNNFIGRYNKPWEYN